MIVYANAKINLGLFVTRKREDGYHDIETVFYPVPLYDIIEFRESDAFRLRTEGIVLDIGYRDNLVYKVYKVFKDKFDIPPVEVFMIKRIPSGAGMGGGSSDAAFFAKGLNEYFGIGLKEKELEALVLKFGSDCPFFIENKPVWATGRGEVMEPLDLDLSGYAIVVVKPDVSVVTAEAYLNIKPLKRGYSLKDTVCQKDFSVWREKVTNDFENYVFSKFQVVKQIKDKMYENGALYASMTGSGSAVYGLFDRDANPDTNVFKGINGFIWKGEM